MNLAVSRSTEPGPQAPGAGLLGRKGLTGPQGSPVTAPSIAQGWLAGRTPQFQCPTNGARPHAQGQSPMLRVRAPRSGSELHVHGQSPTLRVRAPRSGSEPHAQAQTQGQSPCSGSELHTQGPHSGPEPHAQGQSPTLRAPASWKDTHDALTPPPPSSLI